MALPLVNTADGGSNGTTLTAASGGNTGGASGNFFDVITPGTSQTITFDTAVAMAGASIKITLATSAGYVSWTTSMGTLTTSQRMGGRAYLRFSSAPTAAWQFFRVLTGSTLLAAIRLNATSQIQTTNNAGTGLNTGTATLSPATWYRVEWDLLVGTASGTYTVNVYLGDNTTVLDTITGTAAAFGTTAPDTVRFGQAAQSFASGATLNFDDLVVNSTGMTGPARAVPILVMPPPTPY